MALSGFFRIDFGAALPGAPGVVVVENGMVRGSDGIFLFSGTFSDGDGRCRAVVNVKSINGSPLTVFNTHQSSFQLGLEGQADDSSFVLKGGGPVQGQIGITISGRKIADLNF
ncbi:hypothetical protein CSC67_08620 [Pusillimonas caeni]|uniref:GrlR family regulatory protein n=1 Tax=Pusillimonas caeni TaxID=1348472 RepID=UPI000E59DB85|nr:GrlR family regulatory protein [Pusillimonas caeni]TFL14205.1 hypothetical protein CSC67_08620 [Pusillimonas caeni]